MSTLYISDLDGTLLGADSKLSSESERIISDLSQRGALISVATARTPATVVPILADTFTSIPAIVLTGAAMWDRNMGRFISPITIPQSRVPELQRSFLSHGVNPFIYVLAGESHLKVYHNGEMTAPEQHFYDARRNLELKKFVLGQPDAYSTAFDCAILFFGVGPKERIEALADELRGEGGVSVSCYPDCFNRSVMYIEVFDAGVSKAEAVKRLAQMTGADRIVVYGDNLNDLPMFAVADEAVAVENALPAVREAATRIIGPNTASSVARDMAESFDRETK